MLYSSKLIIFLSSVIFTVTLFCKLGVLFEFYTRIGCPNQVFQCRKRDSSTQYSNRGSIQSHPGHTYEETPPRARSFPQTHYCYIILGLSFLGRTSIIPGSPWKDLYWRAGLKEAGFKFAQPSASLPNPGLTATWDTASERVPISVLESTLGASASPNVRLLFTYIA